MAWTWPTLGSVANLLQIIGHLNTNMKELEGELRPYTLMLQDGVPAPAAIPGFALLYVDAADGDLKVKFGDGTVKTIATNP